MDSRTWNRVGWWREQGVNAKWGKTTADLSALPILPACVYRGAVSGSHCVCNSPRIVTATVSLRACTGEAFRRPECPYREVPPEPTSGDNAEYTPKVHDAKLVQSLIDGRAIRPVRIIDRAGPCVHRGDVVRMDVCRSCVGKGKPVEVLACALHGECSVKNWLIPRLRACANCRDHDPRRTINCGTHFVPRNRKRSEQKWQNPRSCESA